MSTNAKTVGDEKYTISYKNILCNYPLSDFFYIRH